MKNVINLIITLLLLNSCNSREDNPVQTTYDTIVIGGGLMGSSTAWHLSEQGSSVVLLEKQDSIYDQGSSLGEARIARSNNRGNDMWSYLHNKSIEETQQLIQFLQSADPSRSYSIEDIYTTSPVTYVGRTTIYEKLLASLIRQKVDYEMAITPEEGIAKFDVSLPDSVLIQREYNQLSGTLNPRQLISYLHRAVTYKGNTVRYNSRVTGLHYDQQSDSYQVMISDEQTGEITSFWSKNIVSAAGPYTGELLKEIAPYFTELINPKRVFLAFLKIKKERYTSLSETEKEKLQTYYPVINSSEGTRNGSFFSMIEYFDENDIPIIKIGGHFQRTEIDKLDAVWSKELTSSEKDWCLNNTAAYFELLNLPISITDIEYVDGYSCVYSLTESEIPLVTPILREDQSPNQRFVVLGGMSGVGAKGAMTYGLIAADWLKPINLRDSMYQVVKKELGFERLKEKSEN